MNKTGHYWILGEMDSNIWLHYMVSFFLAIVLYEVFKRLFFFKRAERVIHAVMIVFAMGVFKEVVMDPHGELIDLIFNGLGICMAVLSMNLYQRTNRISAHRKHPLNDTPHTTTHRNLSPNKIKELNDKIAFIFKPK
jgi:hypothetical protein